MVTAQKQESVVLERSYVVPLRDAWNSAYHKRSKKAIRLLREFASRHMKAEIENIYIDRKLNEKIWSRGNANPPRKVRVIMKKFDSGRVIIYDYDAHLGAVKNYQNKQEKKSDVAEHDKKESSKNTTTSEISEKSEKEDVETAPKDTNKK